MESLFLTVEDVERLTGYKRKAQQCDMLDKMHVPYRVNARGEPIVATASINGGTAPKAAPTWQPNLAIFN